MIFTDASKTTERCTTAIFNSNSGEYKRHELFSETNILAAEQLAILLALHYCSQISIPEQSNVLIITDSLTAVKNICRPLYKHTSDTIILRIRNYLQHFTIGKLCHISFLWVPSHRGILGNEFVDSLAKSTIENTHFFRFIQHTDILHDIKADNLKSWTELYINSINHKSIYFQIQPRLPPRPWYSKFNNIPRHPAILISRLRFNHNRLPANLARFIPQVDSLCNFHQDNPQKATLLHVLFVCPAIHKERVKLEADLIRLKIPRPWSHITLLHSPTLEEAKILFKFFRSIRDRFPV